MDRSELSKKLEMELLRLQKEIIISKGRKLRMLLWQYAKLTSRINEIKEPAPLELKRYDD